MTRLGTAFRAMRSQYSYAASDYLTYLIRGETPGRLRDFPSVRMGPVETGFARVSIGNDEYHWPAAADASGLPWIYQEVYAPASRNAHAYEFGSVSVKQGDLVVDAGASEGFFTRYALDRGARVVAAEPLPELAEALRRTFAREIADGTVRVIEAALGAQSGRANLEQGATLFEGSLGGDGVEVSLVRLDEVLGDTGADFVKMDVEGAEMDALRGALGLIASCKPRLAIAVYHGLENARQVAEILRSARPDYQIRYRGIFALDGIPPRPFMVFAW